MRQPKNGFILLINFNEVVHIESTGFKCLLKNLEIGVFKHVHGKSKPSYIVKLTISNVKPLNGTDIM